MARETSEVWKSLWRSENTQIEYAFDINGEWYGPESETSHSVDSSLYDEFGIGNTASATLKLSLFAKDIPRSSTIKRFVRLKNVDIESEWMPAGVFFTNRRSEEDGFWEVEAFDVMRKTEVIWTPDQSLVFPMPMTNALDILSGIIGAEIDERTYINPSYSIDYPGSEDTIRMILGWIAAAHAGNWVVTGEGKLLLVPLISIPEETHFLVDEHGDNITFGGVSILV